MEVIRKYFPELTTNQVSQFEKLPMLYEDWNQKINVISRKDISNLFIHHILHSLSIAKVNPFLPSSKILDVGTGGGFPGIPLAILFPGTHFYLVDSIGKKIKVVQAIADELGLKNVKTAHSRAEEVNEKFDFVVSRAVAQLPEFAVWVKDKFFPASKHAMANGILYLKGGDLTSEIKPFRNIKIFELKDYFAEDFFETKKIVYVPKKSLA